MISFGYTGLNYCPWTGEPLINNIQAYSSGSETTATLPFPGGWKPSTNSYSGTYNYLAYNDPTLGPAYALEVVPNFAHNTWIGTSPNCNVSTTDCTNYKAGILPENIMPKMWTGYRSGDVTKGGVQIPSTGCNVCSISGEHVLCTTDTQMSLDSCPGATGEYSLSQSPMVETRSTYFDVPNLTNYPRGKGRCIYPANIIKNDNDLINLMALSSSNLINPNLAIDLGLNYCYASVTGQYCGLDSNGSHIENCTRYAVDKNSANVITPPCVDLVNNILGTAGGDHKLNSVNAAWCNNPNNMYTPLCDCLMAGDNDPTNPIAVRSAYAKITNDLLPNVGSVLPKECWFKPCSQSSGYAIPYYNQNVVCPANVINCNNIFDSTNSGLIDNSQYMSCSFNQSSPPINTTTPTNNNIPSLSGNNTVIYLLITFISIVIIGFIFSITLAKSNKVVNNGKSTIKHT